MCAQITTSMKCIQRQSLNLNRECEKILILSLCYEQNILYILLFCVHIAFLYNFSLHLTMLLYFYGKYVGQKVLFQFDCLNRSLSSQK